MILHSKFGLNVYIEDMTISCYCWLFYTHFFERFFALTFFASCKKCKKLATLVKILQKYPFLFQKQRQNPSRDEDDYGFASGAQALPNGHHAGQEPRNDPSADKWYLHDSMRPVGAPAHGANCKCYRCQRKMTAI